MRIPIWLPEELPYEYAYWCVREDGWRWANPCNPKVVVNKEALQSTELG